MIGAIAGDIIGSVYENHPIKTKNFPLFSHKSRFTDDSVLTVAVAHAILNRSSYGTALQDIGRRHPNAGYGGSFIRWLFSNDKKPYNSWGNGAAMRVSPVGFAFSSKMEILHQAQRTAEISHNHPEGIKGAQATAFSIFLARTGTPKEEIRVRIANTFGYNLNRSIEEIRPEYTFDISCQGTVPEAIIAFLDSESFEDAVRNAVSLGGDSDTLACITGGIAEAFYGKVPDYIQTEVRKRLTPDLLKITNRFCEHFL